MWGAFGENDISPFEMGRVNYLRDQQNAILQPAEMIRRAPPFEDIPFLYDMDRQTVPHASTPKRFGVDIFENGVQDSKSSLIDLPARPDDAVEPIDGRAIDLWCRAASKLDRTADCDGQSSLPELGPVLVSRKSLSDGHRTRNRSWELYSAIGPLTLDSNLRAEDALVKPLWPSYVMLSGEVFDPTAIS